MSSSIADLARRLSKISVQRAWSPYTSFDWPESLDPTAHHYMSPELTSLYGTPLYDGLSDTERKRLSFYEVNNFFSLVLLGERPLISGMTDRMYTKQTMGEVTEYLHHFVEEENRHMVIFSTFCNRYLGRIYPEKKMVVEREYAKGEKDIAFFCKVLIVEEIGDYYNHAMKNDERIHPLVRQINDYHQKDEARHLGFGRAWTAELFAKHSAEWSPDTLTSFRKWLTDYLKSQWADFYNPAVYKDAGLDNPYEIRQIALNHPTCREFRERVSTKLVKYFLQHGFLVEAPSL
jgi:hypothetical protein